MDVAVVCVGGGGGGTGGYVVACFLFADQVPLSSWLSLMSRPQIRSKGFPPEGRVPAHQR